MMKLTDIVKKQGNRYHLRVDGGYACTVDIETITDFGLRVNMDIDEDLLEEIKESAYNRMAMQYAYRLLSYRDHGSKELYDKLCRKVSKQVAADTVAKLVGLGYLDDTKYAKRLVEHYIEQKGFSKKRTIQEMRLKGVDPALAEQLVGAVEVDEEEQVTAVIDKKYLRTLGQENGTRRVINALLRQGFSYDAIKRALLPYGKEEEEEWQSE